MFLGFGQMREDLDLTQDSTPIDLTSSIVSSGGKACSVSSALGLDPEALRAFYADVTRGLIDADAEHPVEPEHQGTLLPPRITSGLDFEAGIRPDGIETITFFGRKPLSLPLQIGRTNFLDLLSDTLDEVTKLLETGIPEKQLQVLEAALIKKLCINTSPSEARDKAVQILKQQINGWKDRFSQEGAEAHQVFILEQLNNGSLIVVEENLGARTMPQEGINKVTKALSHVILQRLLEQVMEEEFLTQANAEHEAEIGNQLQQA